MDMLEDFNNVVLAELPKKLPLKCEVDHHIELVLADQPPSPPELEELHRQLKELLNVGYIQPSIPPYGVLVLLQMSHDRSLQLCIDYHALNKLTVKNK